MPPSLYEQAKQFIEQYYSELGLPEEEKQLRLSEVQADIDATGTYEPTTSELTYGAKVAWRNSNRCIGRLFWEKLHVNDARHLDKEEDIAEALLHHINEATNGGKIRSTITVFSEGVRIWNHQLLRYAGYVNEDGSVTGDPHSVEMTAQCLNLGWQSQRTAFDILPLVIQVNDGAPALFLIPESIILRVPLQHSAYPAFDDLGIEWYAVPIISDMALDIGGLLYRAAPFNGWYMETEIGARNLADEDRYNLLPMMGEIMQLNMTHESSLWRDKALVELNVAVLESFRKHGVTLVDHHTAAKQFKRFEMNEQKACRHMTGDWTWLIPPVSPATTHIFHQPYDNTMHSPNYLYQQAPYKVD
ncbi:nitric oxide synthase oxygenase [Bacillaceae bacterium SIJ1]|uniref:nitric oxide synthase oxygenase n=1 Tax=Litoribacterium kuwaitense TaxID=1398745 RepID=UPI0013ED6C84|nr:nitric oxide synthase oxygenase [Litoribacterium kuwaitense]NGP46276.1 nitric oxide synthase oxygenase [Litoribacterium kuwaitense]